MPRMQLQLGDAAHQLRAVLMGQGGLYKLGRRLPGRLQLLEGHSS